MMMNKPFFKFSKKYIVLFMCKKIHFCLLLVLLSYLSWAKTDDDNIPQAVKDAAQSVIQVKTVVNTPKGYSPQARGTGFFIKKDSNRIEVVTNFHVILENVWEHQQSPDHSASPVTYFLHGEKKPYGSAQVVQLSAHNDIAILKPNISKTILPPPLQIRTEPLTAEDSLYIIGFPKGTFIIREINLITDHQDFYPNTFVVPNSVPKWNGASGGPIVDQEGKVVFYVTTGINIFGIIGGNNIQFSQDDFLTSCQKNSSDYLIKCIQEVAGKLYEEAQKGSASAQYELWNLNSSLYESIHFSILVDSITDVKEKGFLPFLRQSALSDHLEAQYSFFMSYINYYQNYEHQMPSISYHFQSYPEDLELARNIGIALADKGFLTAQMMVAEMWYLGLGVEKNIDKTMEYLDKAIEQHPNGAPAIIKMWNHLMTEH